MLEDQFQILLILVVALCVSAALARFLSLAPAITSLIGGIALAYVPGMPGMELPPSLILLVVLPPLIYSSSVAMSWREFRFNIRPIMLLAIGCVLFTAVAVGTATHLIIGLPWSVGFLLGAIVAPPDVVAPLAIAKRLGLPHRILVVLEGEGLVNDATTLIIYRFAVVAIVTGTFSLSKAATTFLAIIVGEILFGMFIGWTMLRVRKLARNPQIEITLSLITPYLAFWVPEHLGGSGVIATVVCGLYMSWNGPLLISSTTRLQGIFFWDLVIFLIEGLLFLLTGFQLRHLFEKSQNFPIENIILTTVVVGAVIVIARFAWVFPATYLPRMIPAIRRYDPPPPWTVPFIIGFTGVRGAVSLAAALALPILMPDGSGFPYRDLILVVSFNIILLTMIGFGLTLPAVVRLLGINATAQEETVAERLAEIAGRRAALEDAKARLERIRINCGLSDDALHLLGAWHDTRSSQLPETLDPDHVNTPAERGSALYELISSERIFIHRLLRDGKISDESRRRIERDLDLEEAIQLNREYKYTPL